MKEKELMHFILSLYNRGLLVKSPEELDYEWVIWDYLKVPDKIVIKSRCCGRCDGVNDICVTDMTCEDHKETGCEICYGPRTTEVKVVSLPYEKRKEMIQKVLDRK